MCLLSKCVISTTKGNAYRPFDINVIIIIVILIIITIVVFIIKHISSIWYELLSLTWLTSVKISSEIHTELWIDITAWMFSDKFNEAI